MSRLRHPRLRQEGWEHRGLLFSVIGVFLAVSWREDLGDGDERYLAMLWP